MYADDVFLLVISNSPEGLQQSSNFDVIYNMLKNGTLK